MNSSPSIRHTGLVVSSINQSLRLWVDILDFKLLNHQLESGKHIDAMMGLVDVSVFTAKLTSSNGYMLELLEFISHSDSLNHIQPYTLGFTHIALTVDDLDLLIPKLIDYGFEFPSDPQLSSTGHVRVVYCRAPEGFLLELVQEVSPL